MVYNKYDELKGKQSILIELINRKEVSDMSDKLTLKELTEIVVKGFAKQREFNAAILKRLDKIDDILERNNLH
ncbi:MAG: hypothetical protein ACRC4M_03110 [Mycoplasma sp.]